jgi:hypothetical protein
MGGSGLGAAIPPPTVRVEPSRDTVAVWKQCLDWARHERGNVTRNSLPRRSRRPGKQTAINVELASSDIGRFV